MEVLGTEVEKKIETGWLLAFYGPLLTQRQQELMRLSCEEDLSLGEIALQAGVSRQGVHDVLHRATLQLKDFEDKLGMLARFRRMQEGLSQSLQALERVQATDDTNKELCKARQVLGSLLREDEEEPHGL